ncbi:HNH endonuclease [Mammaliicoccus sciuri]|uniref:HNH endonuclease n=1 Tax=Mammaliicoccus sciuri TaxID=1296 RepID=UPI001954573B|nr:HNH endonuclease [Mammaliicoccus sciuri]
MNVNKEQKEFCNRVKEMNKNEIDVNNKTSVIKSVVYNLFDMYIKGDYETKLTTSDMIARIQPSIQKRIKLWHLIDKNEFIRCLNEFNRRKHRTNVHSQKSRHKNLNFDGMTYDEWDETVKYFNNKCAYCGSDEKLTYDHIHPFSKGGDFFIGNIIPACRTCNSSKGKMAMEDWYKTKDFYSKSRLNKINKHINKYNQLTLL